MIETGIRECRELIGEGGDGVALFGSRLILARYFARIGEKAEARRLMDEIPYEIQSIYVSDRFASIWVALGEHDFAIELLEDGIAANQVINLALEIFDPIRSDPRFVDLERRAASANAPQ